MNRRNASHFGRLQLAMLLLSPKRSGWWSVAELAEACGYSRASIYRWLVDLQSNGIRIQYGSELGQPTLGVRCPQVIRDRRP